MPKRKKETEEHPKELGEDIIQKLEEAFAFGASDIEACFYAGISQRQLHDYIQKHPDFGDRRELLKQRPTLLARQTLMKALKEDPKVALEYLDRISGEV